MHGISTADKLVLMLLDPPMAIRKKKKKYVAASIYLDRDYYVLHM